MTDMFTRKKRSEIMSRIRSRGNAATELRFIKIMRLRRITGWRRGSKLPGQPDFVFPKNRVAVFIDSDFWHGNPREFRLPRSNLRYWRRKILSNKERDRRVNRTLRAEGWRVLRFWQSSLACMASVTARLQHALCGPGFRARENRGRCPCLRQGAAQNL